MCVAAAIAGAAVVGGIGGGIIQGNAAQSAANTQAGAAENAANLQYQEQQNIIGMEQPYLQAGQGALGTLEQGLGIGGPQKGSSLGYGSLTQPFTTQNWQQLSPAYNFQRQQGMQGTLNADATGQGALSGAAQKDLMGFNQNLANTSFNNAFNMYQQQQGNIYQRLAGLSQLGQSAASLTGQTGTALAGNAGQAVQNVGTALAGGQVGAANAYAGALGNTGTLGMLYAMNGGGGGFGGDFSPADYTAIDAGYNAYANE